MIFFSSLQPHPSQGRDASGQTRRRLVRGRSSRRVDDAVGKNLAGRGQSPEARSGSARGLRGLRQGGSEVRRSSKIEMDYGGPVCNWYLAVLVTLINLRAAAFSVDVLSCAR